MRRREMLTVAETAERFGVSRQHVHRWIKHGRIRATWIWGVAGPEGGQWLISERARRPKIYRPWERTERRAEQ